MATALDLGNADLEGVQFQSLRPLLSGAGRGLNAVYGAYMNRQRAVIHDGWKLILYPQARVARLYHLAQDPQELKDLAGDPALAGRQKALFAKLRDLQREFADPLDLETTFPHLR
jgi:choline-sulfatase